MPSPTISSYFTYIRSRLGSDLSEGNNRFINDQQLEDIIISAVEQYSVHKPNILVVDVTGNGTNAYNLATLVTTFEIDWSWIIDVEYPRGEQPPNILKEAEWRIYRTTSQTQFYLNSMTPSSTETIRLRFAARHTLNETTTTIPEGDWKAVAILGASLAADTLAANFGSLRDTRGGGATSSLDRAEFFERLAVRLLSEYKRRMGIPLTETGQKPVTVTFDIDPSTPHGTGLLTHPKR